MYWQNVREGGRLERVPMGEDELTHHKYLYPLLQVEQTKGFSALEMCLPRFMVEWVIDFSLGFWSGIGSLGMVRLWFFCALLIVVWLFPGVTAFKMFRATWCSECIVEPLSGGGIIVVPEVDGVFRGNKHSELWLS